jgi:hypothetical protein
MTFRGTMKNGVVVLENPTRIPEGAPVSVRVLKQRRGSARQFAKNDGHTLYDTLKNVIGKAKGMPSDAARNHDHYLYGVPKR